MKKSVIRLFVSGAFAMVLAATAQGVEWLSGYEVRQMVAVQNMGNTTELANFPLLIGPPVGDDVYIMAQHADGWDIVFTDDDGITMLPHEIVNFNASNQTMEAWVKTSVPALSQTNMIYMYYGKSGVTVDPSATATWAGDYGIVAHLGEASSPRYDSTASGNSFTNVVGTAAYTSAGRIGGGCYFDSASALISSSASGLSMSTTGYTFQVWVNGLAGGIANNYALGMKAPSRYPMNLTLVSTTFTFNDGMGWKSCSAGDDLRGDGWVHVVGTYDLANLKLYTNGVLAATLANSGFTIYGQYNQALYLGGDFGGGQRMKGTLDEFRLIGSRVWTTNDVVANYNMQRAPNSYVSYSLPVARDPAWLSSYTGCQSIMITDMGNATRLREFPVLVSPSADNRVYSRTRHTNGWDIAFTAVDGHTLLSHEIVEFDASAETMEAWVKTVVPEPGQTNTIYMYYGKSGITADPSTTATWVGDYGIVAHLGEASSPRYDSTASVNSFTNVVGTAAHSNDGRIGAGSYFDGASAIRASWTNGLMTPNGYTFQVWVDALTGSVNNYAVSMLDAGQFYPMNLLLASGAVSVYDSWYGWKSASEGQSILNQGWTYCVGTFDGANLSFYRNGSQVATTNITVRASYGTMNSTLYLGSDYTGNQRMKGVMDEFRLAGRVWSADEVMANYNMQNEPNNYVSYEHVGLMGTVIILQ